VTDNPAAEKGNALPTAEQIERARRRQEERPLRPLDGRTAEHLRSLYVLSNRK